VEPDPSVLEDEIQTVDEEEGKFFSVDFSRAKNASVISWGVGMPDAPIVYPVY
jgi:hypothetical protein